MPAELAGTAEKSRQSGVPRQMHAKAAGPAPGNGAKLPCHCGGRTFPGRPVPKDEEMIPINDENPAELAPVITLAVIGANIAAWVLAQGMGAQLEASVCEYGLIPVEITGREAAGPMICRLGGLGLGAAFTSMFMHGSWLHLGTNMLFLWVFGNNIEDSMGHLRFVVFYLMVGLTAAFVHVLFNASSAVPTVGASGAVSGVLGAYLILYPRAPVHVFFPPFWVFRWPAALVLGYWILIQLVMGLVQVGSGAAAGGVAVWAHIGGFFAGLVLIKFFERRELVTAKREGRRLERSEIRSRHLWA